MKKQTPTIITVVIVGVLLAVSQYYITDQKAKEIKQDITEEIVYNHAVQFGGIENYDIAKQAFSSQGFVSQQRQELQNFLDQTGNQEGQGETEQSNNQQQDSNSQESEFETGQIDQQQVQNILDRGVVLGSPDARIVWLEYSDVNCPYCARQKNDETVINTMEEFEEQQVSHIFRPYPIFGQRSMPGSYALECVADLNEGSYYDYVGDFFALEDKQDQESWMDIASSYDIDTNTLQECIDNEQTEDTVNNNLSEGQMFGVQGTPGNVILDTETGEWTLVSGAYPKQSFVEIIENMLD